MGSLRNLANLGFLIAFWSLVTLSSPKSFSKNPKLYASDSNGK